MKITMYTINNCQFSVQERDYLKANNLQFEEKNLETNREFLAEMMTLSNNFAGTPVTKVEKDDGNIVILKGFTKEEFDQALGLAPVKPAFAEASSGKPAETVTPPTPIIEPKPIEPAQPVTPQAPVAPAPMPEPTTAPTDLPPLEMPPVEPALPTEETTPTPTPEPVNPLPVNPLDSVMNNLQQKANL